MMSVFTTILSGDIFIFKYTIVMHIPLIFTNNKEPGSCLEMQLFRRSRSIFLSKFNNAILVKEEEEEVQIQCVHF